MRYAVASVVLAVMFVGSVLLNLYVSGRVIESSQHHWCSVLTLLTSHPVSPRSGQYVFYLQLKALESRFGC